MSDLTKLQQEVALLEQMNDLLDDIARKRERLYPAEPAPPPTPYNSWLSRGQFGFPKDARLKFVYASPDNNGQYGGTETLIGRWCEFDDQTQQETSDHKWMFYYAVDNTRYPCVDCEALGTPKKCEHGVLRCVNTPECKDRQQRRRDAGGRAQGGINQ